MYQYVDAIGTCMGWDGPVVAGETIANLLTFLSLFILGLQLIYLIIAKPNYLWVFSNSKSVRIIFSGLIIALGIQKAVFVLNMYMPAYMIMGGIDTLCAILAIINMVILQKMTLLLNARQP